MPRLALIPILALLSALPAAPVAAQEAEPTFCTARINDRDVVMGYDKAEARLSDTYSRREQLATRIGRDTVVANVGHDREISILELAELVIARAGSRSSIQHMGLKEAYGEDFEDIRRRRPDLSRLRSMTGFEHRFTLEQTIDELIAIERQRLEDTRNGHCTLVRSQSERAA